MVDNPFDTPVDANPGIETPSTPTTPAPEEVPQEVSPEIQPVEESPVDEQPVDQPVEEEQPVDSGSEPLAEEEKPVDSISNLPLKDPLEEAPVDIPPEVVDKPLESKPREPVGVLDSKALASKIFDEPQIAKLQEEEDLRSHYGETTWGAIKGFANTLFHLPDQLVEGGVAGAGKLAVNTLTGIEMAVHYASKLDPIQAVFDYFDEDGANFREDAHKKFQEAGEALTKGIDEVIPTEGTVASLTSGTIQFVGGFVGAGKLTAAIKGIKSTPGIIEEMTKAGLAEYLGFDEHSSNLSDMMNEVPVLKSLVPDFLTHGDGDNPFEARLKNAAEGVALGLGGAIFGGINALRKMAPKGWIKDVNATIGVRPKTALDEADEIIEDSMLKKHEEFSYRQALAQIIDPKKPKTLYETGRDTLIYLAKAAMLSAPSTQILNFSGNAFALVNNIGEFAIGRGISKLAKGTRFDAVQEGEVGAYVGGMMEGALETFKVIGKSYRQGGDELFGINKFGPPSLAKAMGKDMNEFGLGMKAISHLVDFTGKTAGAVDNVFDHIAFAGSAKLGVFREAVDEGLMGADLSKRIKELQTFLPDSIMERASKHAAYQTFKQPVGDVSKGLKALRTQYPLTQFLVPFFDVLSNVMRYGGDRIPVAGAFFKSNREAWTKGGLDGTMFLAKQAMGSVYTMLGFGLYQGGFLTGSGPKDAREKSAWEAAGKKPHSIKLGANYYDYSQLPGLGAVFQTTASLIEAVEQFSEYGEDEDIATMVAQPMMSFMHSMGNMLMDNTWASGLSEAVELFVNSSNEKTVYNRLSQFAQSKGLMFIPNIVKRAAMSGEEHMKEARTFIEKLQKSIPGFSSGLPNAYDLYGRPKVNTRQGLSGMVSPFVEGQPTEGSEFDKYFAEQNLAISRPGYTQSFQGVKIDMSKHPEVMEQMMKLSGELENNKAPYGGQRLGDYLEELAADQEFRDLDKESQEKAVNKAINAYRQLARDEILATNEEFALEVETTRLANDEKQRAIEELGL